MFNLMFLMLLQSGGHGIVPGLVLLLMTLAVLLFGLSCFAYGRNWGAPAPNSPGLWYGRLIAGGLFCWSLAILLPMYF